MARRGNSLDYSDGTKAAWNYTSGFFAHSLLELGQASGDSAFSDFGSRIVSSCILPDGTIRGYDRDEFNLDMITPGRAVLDLYRTTHEPRFKAAAMVLRHQLADQPRTFDGGFWHKKIYPEQMWLDGLYMAAPFYAEFGEQFGDGGATEDAVRQILLVNQHLYDPSTGLYYHAWDSKRVQPWANPATGVSPNFWGRSIGWYGMATVDILDTLRREKIQTGPVAAVLSRIADGIVRWQDPGTGAWYQVLDKGARPGNYLEATASCMYVYVLAKGINEGWLDSGKYTPAALSGFEGLVREFIRTDAAGATSLEGCCLVAGLGGRNAAGRARDGSFDYYVSEPVVANDLKGVPAFILAGIEVQKLTARGPSIPGR
jgi:unsaturated rhamnogalacturonyl hydrolase